MSKNLIYLAIIVGVLIVLLLAGIGFGFIGSKKNANQVPLSVTPTPIAKNFSASGNIVNQQPQRGETKGWWEFIAENSVSGLRLVLTPSSKCTVQARQFICAESMLLDGERVTITGNQKGNSLFVHSLVETL